MPRRFTEDTSYILLRFVNDTLGSYDMFRNTIAILSKEERAAKRHRDKSAETVKSYLEQHPEKNGKVRLSREEFREFHRLLDARSKAIMMHVRSQNNHSNFRKAIFITLFSRYDAFILDLIRDIYKEDELLATSDRTLRYADIQTSDRRSFKAVRQRFVDEEIERLRDRRTGQLDFIREHSVCPRKLTQRLIPQLVEASERRNILVHHDGRVTHQYRSNLALYGIGDAPKHGVKLTVSEKYMERSVACVLSVAIETTLNLVKKSQREALGVEMVEDQFGILLDSGQYNLILSIADSIYSSEGLSSELRNALLINIALAHKELGAPRNMANAIKKLSRIKGTHIKVAKACLLDDYSGAIKLLDAAGDKELASLTEAMKDPANPVFHSLLDSDEYKEYMSQRAALNQGENGVVVKQDK